MLEVSFTKLIDFNLLSANPTKWSNTLKQFVGNLPTNCLSVFDHFMNLALKGLSGVYNKIMRNQCFRRLFQTIARRLFKAFLSCGSFLKAFNRSN